MLILLSPAKSLDFEALAPVKSPTEPRFLKKSATLIKELRKLDAAELSRLMKISKDLGELNDGRNRKWKQKHDAVTAKSAVYAFQGDVYQGLAIDELNAASVKRCQRHVRILSGLYGLLRPFDLIQPYRLEMGTKLKTDSGNDLYQFWAETIHDAVVDDLAKLKSRLVVNLASNEYSRAAKLTNLKADVISPAFHDWKNGEYKIISFFAKKARGLMTRFVVENGVKTAVGLRDFALDGYSYNDKLSTDATPVFTRKRA